MNSLIKAAFLRHVQVIDFLYQNKHSILFPQHKYSIFCTNTSALSFPSADMSSRSFESAQEIYNRVKSSLSVLRNHNHQCGPLMDDVERYLTEIENAASIVKGAFSDEQRNNSLTKLDQAASSGVNLRDTIIRACGQLKGDPGQFDWNEILEQVQSYNAYWRTLPEWNDSSTHEAVADTAPAKGISFDVPSSGNTAAITAVGNPYLSEHANHKDFGEVFDLMSWISSADVRDCMTLPFVSLTIPLQVKLSSWGLRASANQAPADPLMPSIDPQMVEAEIMDTSTDRLMRRFSQTSVSAGDKKDGDKKDVVGNQEPLSTTEDTVMEDV